ncbi:uncharacterized protein [Spinacia oleracea]|uniref:Uncharacterized protein n=1 Tax=Spinacia oleracea TaxID=3562 RepID=A0ABM3QXW9_SPIOL|nr:uncharacterized protein LOC130463184 [Spinacia oleracea]
MLAQDERQREISTPVPSHDSHAFAVDRRRYNDYHRGGYRGQQSSNTGRSAYGNFGGNKSANFRRPVASYFCDHCKVNGHSTERCFKLHGFPPGFTGFKTDKRAAAAAYSDEGYGDDMTEYQQQFYTPEKEPQQSQPGFLIAEQCTQLLNLLNKQQQQPDKVTPDTEFEEGDTSGHAFMAGPFNERATGSW